MGDIVKLLAIEQSMSWHQFPDIFIISEWEQTLKKGGREYKIKNMTCNTFPQLESNYGMFLTGCLQLNHLTTGMLTTTVLK